MGHSIRKSIEDNNERFYDIDKVEEIKPNLNHIITDHYMKKLKINNENKKQNRTTYTRLKDIARTDGKN